jgi:hypothetical protein
MPFVNAIQHGNSYLLFSLCAVPTDNDHHFHHIHSEFSSQKPNILKKQPNVTCLKFNFEQETPKNPKNRVFLFFGQTLINILFIKNLFLTVSKYKPQIKI